MKRILTYVGRTDLLFHVISMVVLALMMCITLVDVVARNFGYPIVGVIEIISFGGSVVVGFAIPYSSWKKAHVYVDLLIDKLSPGKRNVVNGITRCIGMALFIFAGVNFIIYALDLLRTGEVSPSFKLPYYPIAFGLSLSCFLESITLFADLLRTVKGGDNE
ncbi:MAG: Tripartite ATP-independent periplasmic transporter [Syntrophorhabdus sp. PtaU1.Bin153]|nr:MAG: Tripartite ATP-independent periplasmic transporter [Syntrophorhabdus sp. PtaU1.Bin153]